jgi:AcrR family transcriptional regulator
VIRGEVPSTSVEAQPSIAESEPFTRVLDAVFDLFAERGFAGFTMAEVAHRAGVPPAQVHPRGESRADLVVAALTRRMSPMRPAPDTGSLRGDLAEAVRRHIEAIRDHPMLVLAGLGAFECSSEFAAALQDSVRQRIDRYAPMLRRAMDRGELDSSCGVDTAMHLALAQALSRLFDGRTLTLEMGEGMVDLALDGLSPRS